MARRNMLESRSQQWMQSKQSSGKTEKEMEDDINQWMRVAKDQIRWKEKEKYYTRNKFEMEGIPAGDNISSSP